MKRLFITKTGDIQLPEYIKPASKIAVKSAQFSIGWFNLWNDADVIVVKKDLATDLKPTYIKFREGLYTMKDFKGIFNANSKNKVWLDFLQDGKMRIKLMDGYMFTMTDGLPQILGLTIPKHKYFTNEETFGFPNFNTVKSLHLHCREIDNEDNWLDGEKSKLLHIFSLKTGNELKEVKIFNYENPVYIPLHGSTDMLHFELTDQGGGNLGNSVQFIEFLIK